MKNLQYYEKLLHEIEKFIKEHGIKVNISQLDSNLSFDVPCLDKKHAGDINLCIAVSEEEGPVINYIKCSFYVVDGFDSLKYYTKIESLDEFKKFIEQLYSMLLINDEFYGCTETLKLLIDDKEEELLKSLKLEESSDADKKPKKNKKLDKEEKLKELFKIEKSSDEKQDKVEDPLKDIDIEKIIKFIKKKDKLSYLLKLLLKNK